MEVIFLIGAVQAFFLTLLIFNKAKKSNADFVLAAWLALMGFHLLYRYIFIAGVFLDFPYFISIGVSFPLLQGPFMLVYIWVATGKNDRMVPMYWLHGLPYLIFTVFFIVDFNLLTQDKMAYLQQIRSYDLVVSNILAVLSHTHGPAYLVWSLYVLRKHSKKLQNNFSFREGIDFKWLHNVLFGLGVVWFIVLVAGILEYLSGGKLRSLGDDAIFIAVTLVVFFLGYFGIKQRAIYDQIPADLHLVESNSTPDGSQKEHKRYERSGLKKEEAEKYIKELLQYMEDKEPWLNSKLNLKDVADHLNLSVHHLSQIINEQLGKTFFDFVNEYRVKEVKKLIEESKHEQFTLLAIAHQSGFNSKSSFNSIFKRLTKVTPSEYIKSLQPVT